MNSKALKIVENLLDFKKIYDYQTTSQIVNNLLTNANPKAFEILLNNLDCLNKLYANYLPNLIMNIWSKPDIFEYDYDKMKENRENIINKIELNNLRLRRALYYQTKYNYNLILDEYIK